MSPARHLTLVSDDDTFDRDAAESYLRTLFGDGETGWLGLSWFDEEKRNFRTNTVEPGMTSKAFHGVGSLLTKASSIESPSIYLRGTTTSKKPKAGSRGRWDDSLVLPGLWADLDFGTVGHKHKPELYKGLMLPPDAETVYSTIAAAGLPEPTLVVHSGGGLYPWWLFAEPLYLDEESQVAMSNLSRDWQRQLRAGAETLGYYYGAGVGDLARVLRLPGTINGKDPGNPRPCHVIDLSEPLGGCGVRYDVEDLEMLLDVAGLKVPRGVDTRPEDKHYSDEDLEEIRVQRALDPGVFDVLEDEVGIEQVLLAAGWTICGCARMDPHGGDADTCFTRPGGSGSGNTHSAHIPNTGVPVLVVFSEEAGLPAGGGERLTAARVFAYLHHKGDLSAAAKDLGDARWSGSGSLYARELLKRGLTPNPNGPLAAGDDADGAEDDDRGASPRGGPGDDLEDELSALLGDVALAVAASQPAPAVVAPPVLVPPPAPATPAKPSGHDAYVPEPKWPSKVIPGPSHPDGAAAAYAQGRNVRHWGGSWMVHTGNRWVERYADDFRAEVASWLRARKHIDSTGATVAWNVHPKPLGYVITMLSTIVNLPFETQIGDWIGPGNGPAGTWLSVAEGRLNIETKELLPHDPRLFNLTSVPISYDPEATCPEWDRSMEQWFPEQDSRDALYQQMAYALSDRRDMQKGMLLLGPTRSGKSTIVAVMSQFMEAAGLSLTQLGEQFGLQHTIGKRLAIVGDTAVGENRKEKPEAVSRIKSLIGNDRMTIDRKNRTPWEGKPGFALWILANDVPAWADPSGAVAERWIAIRTARSFKGQEDTGLEERILARELPGVLNRILDAMLKLPDKHRRERFIQPESGLGDMSMLAESGSTIKKFIDDECIVAKQVEVDGVMVRAEVEVGELRDAYNAWRKDVEGLDYRVPAAAFGRDLKSAENTIVRAERGKKGTSHWKRVYTGIMLRPRDLLDHLGDPACGSLDRCAPGVPGSPALTDGSPNPFWSMRCYCEEAGTPDE